MAYTFFHIRALDPQEESERLNAFLASHAVLQVDRHFVADGENSFWSVCVLLPADDPAWRKQCLRPGLPFDG